MTNVNIYNVIGYDEYVKDFEDCVTADYRMMAEEFLIGAVESCGEDAESFEIVVDGEMCADHEGKSFKFMVDFEIRSEAVAGGVVYLGVY